MNFKITSGNADDRGAVEHLCSSLKSLLFGDRGYISKKLNSKLHKEGLQLITNLKKNMKQYFITPIQKYLLSKSRIIETVIGNIRYIFNVTIQDFSK
jgi:hypothetical protein